MIARLQRRRLTNPNVHAVGAALVAHQELVVSVEEVRVPGADPRVRRERDLRVGGARDVLGALQQVAEAIGPLGPTDQETSKPGSSLYPLGSRNVLAH